MKLILAPLIAITFIISSSILSAQQKVQLIGEKDKISYSIGLNIGHNFKQQSIEIKLEPLFKGIEDALLNKKPLMSNEEIKVTMDSFRKQMTEKIKKKKEGAAAQNVKDGKGFLEKNKLEKGIITLPSGLQYRIVKEGSGIKPVLTDTVVTHYRGKLLSGVEFDSSYKRGKPATFPVNGVIKGWTEALQLMTVGSKWELFIPAHLAYGKNGASNVIGPNATLIFDIELLEIKAQK